MILSQECYNIILYEIWCKYAIIILKILFKYKLELVDIGTDNGY